MIKSMTGFGRAEVLDESHKFTIELKTVNHRYLDMSVRLPRQLGFFETAVRNYLKKYLLRGKVDVFIFYEDYSPQKVLLTYNGELVKQYLAYFRQMESEFGVENDITLSTLARLPEIFNMEQQAQDEDSLWKLLEEGLKKAVANVVEARELEGAHLKKDIQRKLDALEEKVAQIEERSPQVLAAYREKLEAKAAEMLQDVQMEESRIAAEVVIYADKICCDEETVRLKSHIKNMGQALEQGGGTGRKLDFIAQEMNRESNTILSKANDLETSNIAIDLKTEIEKIREQIQNIE
ncbi:MAG: YicC family protein [Lachnospiraceae bacterium]|nr:YicC family protein [Lachnospiraceae bacterium]